MQAYVKEDQRPLTRLYDKAFTAVNAPNVLYQKVTTMAEPFQPRSMFPLGEAPVRYPDLTTVPGFLDNPAQDFSDVRHQLERMAEDHDQLFPEHHDWNAVAKQDFQKDKSGSLSAQERAERVALPYAPLGGTYPSANTVNPNFIGW